MVTSSASRPGRTRAVDVERVLLDAAHRLLEQEGAAAVTVRRVAAEAGVAPMGLYHRFGGKEGLMQALFSDGFAALTAALLDRSAGDALNELRAGCQQYRCFALANPALYAVMFDRVVPGLTLTAPGIARCSGAFAVLVDGVRRAQAAGAIRSGDATDMAQQIWSALHGAVSLELRGIGFIEDHAANYASMIETILAGLAPRP
jgi:AcrR family transcriptional regulator